MNVAVREPRAEAVPAPHHRRLRHPSQSALARRGAAVPAAALAAPFGGVRQSVARDVLRHHRLSAHGTGHLARRRLAARRRPARLRPGVHAPAAPGPQRRGDRQPHPADHARAGPAQPRLRRRALHGAQRLAARVLAQEGAAPARLRDGAGRGPGGGCGRDRAPRRRSAVRPGAAAAAHRRAAGPAPLPPDAGGRDGREPPGGDPRRRPGRALRHQHRLALLLHRGAPFQRADHAVAADEPGGGGRVRGHPWPAHRTDRKRVRLGATAVLAARQPVEAVPRGGPASSSCSPRSTCAATCGSPPSPSTSRSARAT